jgi:hypothetical protein
MQVSITKADKGKVWTYDCWQRLLIQHVDADSIKVKDIDQSYTTPRRITIKRFKELFACGRAEWGDCVDDDDDSVIKAKW